MTPRRETCAQFIDELPDVTFWVRNLARKATSFRLQTSKDWFYPDFLCQLTDGRALAVEYKGKHLYDGIDSEEKRAVGAVWASRSGGRCLFVMPTEGGFSTITRAVRPSGKERGAVPYPVLPDSLLKAAEVKPPSYRKDQEGAGGGHGV